VRVGFGAAGFLAAADAGAAVELGRGDGSGAFATGDDADEAAGERGAGGVVAGLGSAVMMLIGGVEAAVGNSALVGLPVGIEGGNVATGATAAVVAAGGAFHDGA
jgi:hypothetical protein